MMLRVPRVARRRERQIEARAADGELVGRELPQDDRAGLAQLRDHRRIGRGDVVHQDLGMARGRQAGDIDDVLDADRHAVQRPSHTARGDLGLGRACGVHRGIGIQPDEGVQLRIEPLDARQQRVQQFDR